MRDHLSYYKKINNIPTADVNDLNKKILFKQRFNFYFKIGVTESELKNKCISKKSNASVLQVIRSSIVLRINSYIFFFRQSIFFSF